MVSHKLHNEYAIKMGISLRCSKEANKKIDFSDEGHDAAVEDIATFIGQTNELFPKYGYDIIKAYILHIQLDKIDRYIIRNKNNEIGRDVIDYVLSRQMLFFYSVCKKYKYNGVDYRDIIIQVNKFIERNRDVILLDIKKDIQQRMESGFIKYNV